MGRLPPNEEEKMAHSYHSYSIIGFMALIFSLIPLLCTAYEHWHFTIALPDLNFGWTFQIAVAAGRTWDASLDEVDFRHFDGDSEYNQLALQKYSPEEVARVYKNPWALWKYKLIINEPDLYRNQIVKPLSPGSSATFLRDQYRFLFGTTDFNLCNYKPDGRPNGLPSILRTFQLSCAAQLAVRVMLLSTFYIRWYYTFLRCIPVSNAKTGIVLRSLAFLAPKLQLIESIFAFLISCLHQDNDVPLLFLFPTVLIGWAISICAYILVFTLLSLLDGTLQASSRLAQIRFVCFSFCIFCSPIWIRNHLPFIEAKSCFTEVPVREALSEYATVAAVITFVATQLYEIRNFRGLLSCSDHDYCVELNSEFEEVYRPALMRVRQAVIRNRLSPSYSKKSSDFFFIDQMSV